NRIVTRSRSAAVNGRSTGRWKCARTGGAAAAASRRRRSSATRRSLSRSISVLDFRRDPISDPGKGAAYVADCMRTPLEMRTDDRRGGKICEAAGRVQPGCRFLGTGLTAVTESGASSGRAEYEVATWVVTKADESSRADADGWSRAGRCVTSM